MTLKHGLTRILAAALAIAAVAAPAAVAQPAETWSDLYAVAPLKALGTGATLTAPDQQSPVSGGQDLRSPDAADPVGEGSQDLRSPDAADPSMPSSPQPSSSRPCRRSKGRHALVDDRPPARRRLSRLAAAAVTAGRIRRRAATA